MTKFELEDGERDLGRWTINYRPPSGGRYLGTLQVTDRRLLFDAKFDTTIRGTFQELYITHGSHAYLCFPREEIVSSEVKKRFLSKRVVVTLACGQEHTFDYGLFSVKKLAAAIEEMRGES